MKNNTIKKHHCVLAVMIFLSSVIDIYGRGELPPPPPFSGGDIGSWLGGGNITDYINWWFEGGDFGGNPYPGNRNGGYRGTGGSSGSGNTGGSGGNACTCGGCNCCRIERPNPYSACQTKLLCLCQAVGNPKNYPVGRLVLGNCIKNSGSDNRCCTEGQSTNNNCKFVNQPRDP